MTYSPIHFRFQVHNDAAVVESAYLCPQGLPWGATLDITPAQADIAPGEAAVFTCRLTLDDSVIRPGCSNDQGFQLSAWRVAHDADEPWGSCFYFVRPRVRTRTEIHKADWYEQRVRVNGQLSLDTDQQVTLAGQLPLQVRVRLEVDAGTGAQPGWVSAAVQPSGIFAVTGPLAGPAGQVLRAQAWFDRTDLLASSRSNPLEGVHVVGPVIG